MVPSSRSSRESSDEFLKVGALARRTGLTVRTLHHYEEVGLLSPAGRNAAGHRLYGRVELRRLHQIVSLKQMGLSLDEIREALDGDTRSLEQILDLQIRRLRARIAAEKDLCGSLEALRDRLRSGDPNVEMGELVDSVGRAVRIEKYYSPEQKAALEARAGTLGPRRLRQAEQEWQELFRAYEAAMRRGKPPDHPDVMDLARRSRELIAAFTGGDPGILDSLENLYRNENPERLMARQGMSMAPGLWEYMQSAAEALADAE